MLGNLLPYRPFRCRSCLKRYWLLQPWVSTLKRFSFFFLIFVLLIVAGGAYFDFIPKAGLFGSGTGPDASAPEVAEPIAPAEPAPDGLAPEASDARTQATPAQGNRTAIAPASRHQPADVEFFRFYLDVPANP